MKTTSMRMADLISPDLLPGVRIPTLAGVHSVLWHLASEYPASLVAAQQRDIPRVTYHVRLALRYASPYPTICDVGGGLGMFSLALAALGYPSILVDDFGSKSCVSINYSALQLHRHYGVQIVSRDLSADGFDLAPESADVITSFCANVLIHQSSQDLFRQLVEILRPGGIVLLCCSRCVNLRQRLAIPFGGAGRISTDERHESDVICTSGCGPNLRDLHSICRDLGLQVLKVAGCNWQGRRSNRLLTRFAASCAGWALRAFPCACSDLYIVGRKPIFYPPTPYRQQN